MGIISLSGVLMNQHPKQFLSLSNAAAEVHAIQLDALVSETACLALHYVNVQIVQMLPRTMTSAMKQMILINMIKVCGD